MAFVLFLLDQDLSNTNASLEDAVCFLPTNTQIYLKIIMMSIRVAGSELRVVRNFRKRA